MVGRTGAQVPQVGPAGWEVTTTCHLTCLLFALLKSCENAPLAVMASPSSQDRSEEVSCSQPEEVLYLGPEKPFQSKTGPFPHDCPLLAPGLSASSSIMRESSEDQAPTSSSLHGNISNQKMIRHLAARDTCRVGSRQPRTPFPPWGLIIRAARH